MLYFVLMLISKIKVVVRQIARDSFRKKIKSLDFLSLNLLFGRIFAVSLFYFRHKDVVSVNETGAFLNLLYQRLRARVSLQVFVDVF